MKLRLWNLLPHDYAPFFRILHIIVAFLILSQIINSNLTETEAIGEHSLEGVITWMHIISGLGLIICGFIMLSWMLTQRGFTYYFSWVGLDFSGIKQDIKTLTSFRLPDAHSGGIAKYNPRIWSSSIANCSTFRWPMVLVEYHAVKSG